MDFHYSWVFVICFDYYFFFFVDVGSVILLSDLVCNLNIN